MTELTALFRFGLTGNQIAYAQFLEKITPLLKRITAKKCAACDIDDVVQEILISIHKARHTYDGERPILPWIASIAQFRITDYLRKHYAQRRDKTVDIQGLEDFLPDVTQTTTDNEYIDELLRDAPEHHKQLLMLMHIEGYTAKEVGTKMNMNESAVKVATHRALKKIRHKFNA